VVGHVGMDARAWGSSLPPCANRLEPLRKASGAQVYSAAKPCFRFEKVNPTHALSVG
jgi:hypothetical protein